MLIEMLTNEMLIEINTLVNKNSLNIQNFIKKHKRSNILSLTKVFLHDINAKIK